MKALVTLAIDVSPEGYEQEYGVEPKVKEVLDYVKDLISESGSIRLNLVGGWAQITRADVTPPVEGPPGKTWEEVWEQVREANAIDFLSKFVAIAVPSPFMEEEGSYTVVYVDRGTRIH